MDLSDEEKIKSLYEQIRKETDPEKIAILGDQLRSLLQKERAERRSPSSEEP